MTRNRALVTGLVLLLAAVALSLWAYPALADRVAKKNRRIEGFGSES